VLEPTLWKPGALGGEYIDAARHLSLNIPAGIVTLAEVAVSGFQV